MLSDAQEGIVLAKPFPLLPFISAIPFFALGAVIFLIVRAVKNLHSSLIANRRCDLQLVLSRKVIGIHVVFDKSVQCLHRLL